MDPAATHIYSAQDWSIIIAAIFVGLTSLVGAIGAVMTTIRGRANTVKLDAAVAQTREIARAVPDASTAPTDAVMQSRRADDATTPGAKRATDGV